MIKEKKFRSLLTDFASDVHMKEDVSELVEEFVKKMYPPKKPKVVKYFVLGDDDVDGRGIEVDDEGLELWNEDPSRFITNTIGYSMPNFNQDEDGKRSGKEGQMIFIRINDVLYSFTISKGECIEASYDGSIFETDINEVTLIPKDRESDYNLVDYDWIIHD